jgi:hypothetical protein
MALSQRSASTDPATETAAPQPHLKLLPKPGRPTLFNAERTAAICAIIEQEGISDSAAGALGGVTASTLARWKLEHEGFALELERARALFAGAGAGVRVARKRDGTPDWRAAAWLLKHSSAEGYGPVSRMRKLKMDGAQGHSGAGHAQERSGAARSEKCANLPETPGAEAEPEERNARGGSDERVGLAGPAAQNCAILPETAAGRAREQHTAWPPLSRRERRAEERRLAKAGRLAA